LTTLLTKISWGLFIYAPHTQFLQPVADLLRSTGLVVFVLPRTITTYGECSLFYSGPAAWYTLLTQVHLENDSRVYFLIMLTGDYCWHYWMCHIAAPYKFRVDRLILDGLILTYIAAGHLTYTVGHKKCATLFWTITPHNSRIS